MMPGLLDRAGATGAELPGLSSRQRVVLVAIAEFTRTTGEPCPARYLARRFNLHHSTVQEHLAALYRKGWLRTPNAPAMVRRPVR